MSKNTITNYTAKNGAIIGLGFILSYLLVHLLKGSLHTDGDFSQYLNILIMIAGIIFFTRKYRATEASSYFPYWRAFKVGFLLAIFAAIIGKFFLFVYYNYMSAEALTNLKILSEKNFLLMNELAGKELYTDQLITEELKSLTPFNIAISGILSNTIFGALISFITAAVFRIKSDSNPFNKSMAEIDNNNDASETQQTDQKD
jgi:ABC-type transport system involved in multi-copper enzyme maturation permease subunit